MLDAEDLQKAISIAAEGGLNGTICNVVFEKTDKGWKPRPDCLVAGYSSGERVICGILLAFYIAFHGTPEELIWPADREYNNSPAEYVWPGAWYFVSASNKLSDDASWKAIQMLLSRR